MGVGNFSYNYLFIMKIILITYLYNAIWIETLHEAYGFF